MIVASVAAAFGSLFLNALVPVGIYGLVQRHRHGATWRTIARRTGLTFGEARYVGAGLGFGLLGVAVTIGLLALVDVESVVTESPPLRHTAVAFLIACVSS